MSELLQLGWPGKKEAFRQGLSSVGQAGSLPPNSAHLIAERYLLIEADNLLGLKALLANGSNWYNAIYIDPPYNTGNGSFVYNDQFAGQKHANRHIEWLNMMLPRLQVGWELLASHGLFFISIDDHELAYLKLLTDELFGEENFIDVFSWVKTETPANLSKKSKKVVEYIICYQKGLDGRKLSGIRKFSPSSNGLLNQTNNEKELVFPAGVVQTKMADQVLKKGTYGTDKYTVELLADTEVRAGKFIAPVKLKARFKWGQQKLDAEIAAGTDILIPTIRLSPAYEKKEYAAEVPPNLINKAVGVETNEMAKASLEKLLGANLFDYPKPVSLIKYLLQFLPNPQGRYLDFFAGSGTLAEAVLALNQEDGGQRTFCCIQWAEPCNPKSIAYQNGFNTIADITRFRLQKAFEKYNVPLEQLTHHRL